MAAGVLIVAYVVGKPGHREQPWAARSDTGKLYRTPDTGWGTAEGDGDADAVDVVVGLVDTLPVRDVVTVTLGVKDTVGVTEDEKETVGVTEGVTVAVGLLEELAPWDRDAVAELVGEGVTNGVPDSVPDRVNVPVRVCEDDGVLEVVGEVEGVGAP